MDLFTAVWSLGNWAVLALGCWYFLSRDKRLTDEQRQKEAEFHDKYPSDW